MANINLASDGAKNQHLQVKMRRRFVAFESKHVKVAFCPFSALSPFRHDKSTVNVSAFLNPKALTLRQFTHYFAIIKGGFAKQYEMSTGQTFVLSPFCLESWRLFTTTTRKGSVAQNCLHSLIIHLLSYISSLA